MDRTSMNHRAPAPAPACSLTASAAAERAERWHRLLDRQLLSRTATPGGLRVVFRSDPGVADELDALVEAERECCAFLGLSVERSEERLVLDVAAPAEATAIVQTMFGATAVALALLRRRRRPSP
jgi:MYXO-CTERM domain-containing protein